MNANELLQKAVEALELVPSAGVWAELVSHFGRALSLDWVFVAKFLPASDSKLRTLAAWHRGRAMENFEYEWELPLDDAPAQNIYVCASEARNSVRNAWLKRVKAESYGHIKLVGSLGQSWGMLAFAHSQPLESSTPVEAMLRIYAFKASVELERELADERCYSHILDNLPRT